MEQCIRDICNHQSASWDLREIFSQASPTYVFLCYYAVIASTKK